MTLNDKMALILPNLVVAGAVSSRFAESRFYDISLELDILCPESDSRKLVLRSLVKKSVKLNISLNMQK